MISEIPKEIREIGKLSNLKSFWCNHNKISKIPKEIENTIELTNYYNANIRNICNCKHQNKSLCCCGKKKSIKTTICLFCNRKKAICFKCNARIQ